MPIYGVDVHPRFQAGISIEQVASEGFDFLSVKVSEGTDASYGNSGGRAWIRRGLDVGMLCMGYHYLRPGNEVVQARVFANQLKLADVPGVLDVEAVDNNDTAILSISNVLAFLAECRNQGVNVPLMYLPRWYWERLGKPNLSGLPTLWASSYPSSTPGFASDLYSKVTSTRWQSYGNGPAVAVLQFTDRAKVAGREIDANAFVGTRDDFAKLIGVSDMTPEEHKLLQECRDELYRRLPTRGGPGSDPKYADTILGYSANADGYGWRIEPMIRQLVAQMAEQHKAIDFMQKLLASAPTEPKTF
jgi:Glycosyl hydrolases family 25